MIRTVTGVGITNDQVSVIPLGSIFIGAGVNAVVSGWGQTSNPGALANTLQWASLTTLSNADCRSRFTATNAARVFESNICTFSRAGQGICNGDGGEVWNKIIQIMKLIFSYHQIRWSFGSKWSIDWCCIMGYSLCSWITRCLLPYIIISFMDDECYWIRNINYLVILSLLSFLLCVFTTNDVNFHLIFLFSLEIQSF